MKVIINVENYSVAQVEKLIALGPLTDQAAKKALFAALIDALKKEKYLYRGSEDKGYVPAKDMAYRSFSVDGYTIYYNVLYKCYYLSHSTWFI